MKVTLWMSISLNGLIATLDDSEDFLSSENWPAFVRDVKERGSLIWGRRTYELVKKWDKSYLEDLEGVTKVILSHNPNYPLDPGFMLANSPEHALKILSENNFQDTILSGGSKNNTSFAALNLIDEVIVDLEGIILGEGFPLFKASPFTLSLQLIKTQIVTDNILQLRYSVKK